MVFYLMLGFMDRVWEAAEGVWECVMKNTIFRKKIDRIRILAKFFAGKVSPK